MTIASELQAAADAASTPIVLPPVDRAWQARLTEEILEPDLPIIDPHHHLWGPPRDKYLADDLTADIAAGHKVEQTVYIDCREGFLTEGPEMMRPLGEVRFARGVGEKADEAGGPRLCAGIVGHADLTHGDAIAELLEAQVAEGGGRFRGIRQSAVWDPSGLRTSSRVAPRGLLADPAFRTGFAHLGRLGLSFDSWNYFHQIGELADLARAFPDTTIILDHVGGVLGVGPYEGKRDEHFAQWKAGILDAASCPNVSVKLGGLAMHTVGFGFEHRETPAGSEELAEAWRPYIETCIEAFGADRAMFESNYPVDGVTCSYVVLWNALKRLGAGASADEKAALFKGTARRVYRLD